MDRKYWLWLTRIIGIGIKKQKCLLNVSSSPRELFYMDSKMLEACFKNPLFRSEDVKHFYESRNPSTLIGYERRLEALGVAYVTIDEELYPKALKSLFDPPYVLYYRGVLREHPLSIGVVGSRKCTAYGRKVAEQFGYDLAGNGVNVISGLARGIDTYSHRGALDASGFTTAVLGCGINICYPKENANVMKEIIRNGCVISEYGLDVHPKRGYFPMRNRLISGLSQGVLLIEAKRKSGSLITVDCALEAGRDVFAVPGDVLGGSNEGSNNIIRLGGKPVFDVEDILEEYNTSCDVSGANDDVDLRVQMKIAQLDEDERIIYELLGQIPIFIDELVTVTGQNMGLLQFTLTKLEIKEMAIQLPGKHYIKA